MAAQDTDSGMKDAAQVAQFTAAARAVDHIESHMRRLGDYSSTQLCAILLHIHKELRDSLDVQGGKTGA